ncbi:uncharacterized protein N7496_010612 [Penicillium cataractarum]|uniref:NWD NACHT-NTPase N-terminal domain-containing protein n=1 Tax=Penicillium cataractarum TaxID=2100454 RepID=A0A9W9V241_9EURO|nr:uncharacterized protein N7496_010612 [Penicillium cataractarum]KAJ5364899.1 hypothetical protein N7496_010612 [Penicillium cataractarum]
MRVRELAETAQLGQNTQQRLEQQLLQMEHRTYLWLHLAIDDIRSTFENSFRPAEESVRLIPPSVNHAYERILDRVPPDKVHTVKKVLQIIIAARRPLTTTEMAMALGITLYPESQTAVEAMLDSSQIDKKLRRLCGLFVFINNTKIYLIHQTAREFLIFKANMNSVHDLYSWCLIDTEDQMASICLKYLSMEDLEAEKEELSSDALSFLEYSAVYWADHVRKMSSNSSQELNDRLHQVYKSSGNLFSLWFPIFWKAVMPIHTIPSMKALHLAAFNGHEREVKHLLTINGSDINAADDTSTYPITWASWNGHAEVVQILLDNGADVNSLGGWYGNALQAACLGGRDRIVQILLEKGAEVDAQGGEYGNALQAASSKGHDKIVQMLLEKGADVNAQDEWTGNALQTASSKGYDKIVQMLLEKGADVNAQDEWTGNALQTASSKGYDKIVQMLLEKGADVNAQDEWTGNALQAASSKGYDKIVQMLLEKEADVNARDRLDGYALQAACFGGHGRIVQMLLEKGAEVDDQG